jgi:hypothetical protein
MLHNNKQWDRTQVSQLTLKRLLQYIQELIQHELIYTSQFHSNGHYFIPDYLITYPEVPSFVRRTEFFYRVPRIIIKSVNITVFPHLYKFKILLLLKTLRKNCSIQHNNKQWDRTQVSQLRNVFSNTYKNLYNMFKRHANWLSKLKSFKK